MSDTPRHTNRLADETSPYLLQHAHNPVDWYPWGEEALARAVRLDRPIFLSIGYAACHWCHVMERESFEDEATAKVLDDHYVAIKVDREERPDIDSIYMGALQAMTGSGGWPLNVFLTPEGKPFYGGTYFPDEPRHGIPAFRDLLARLFEVWQTRRDEVEATAERLAQHVRTEQDAPDRLLEALADQPRVDADDRLAQAVDNLSQGFDPVSGGWGSAPLFPQAMAIEFLLREHRRTGAAEPRLIAMRSLEAMAAGGVYDHLGGGFARYSTDARWLVPHFEKMLYDNALLARAYSHAARLSGEDELAYFARETLDFVVHELRNPPGGAFAASLDADTDGVEGLTYVWRADEIREILGDEAPLFESAYGVSDGGNWEGRTILHRVRDDTDLALEHERPRDEIREALAQAGVKLLRVRDERPQPARDDKVLVAWNGLAIAALADTGVALSDPQFVGKATEAADFLLEHSRDDDGRLQRSWKDGRARHAATLEDHAHFADGLLALYQAGFEERFFIAACELADTMLEHFSAEGGGFWDTADDAESLIARPRNLQDNAVPSGSSMATNVLLRLAALTGEGRYRTAAERALAPILGIATQHPIGFANWLMAYQLASAAIDEIAIVGDPDADDTKALLAVARAGYHPDRVLALSATPEASAVPLLHDRIAVDGVATAYVCRDFACQRPTTDPAELARQLEDAAAT